MNIADIYSQLRIPDNSIIANATETLTNLYQDPNVIFSVLEVLKSNPDPFIRRQSAVGLKTLLHNHWYIYCQNPSSKDIINEILLSIQTEPIDVIRHLVIFAIEPIYKNKDKNSAQFTNMIDEFALKCIQSDTTAVLDVGIRLHQIILPYLNEDVIFSYMELLANQIMSLLQASQELIVPAADLIASLTHILSPPLPEPVENMIIMLENLFKNLLLSNSPIIYNIANSLSEAFATSSNCSKNASFLLELANNPEISPDLLFHIFTPLQSLLEQNFEQIETYLESIIITIFKCTAISFQDDCIEEQSNSLYIFNTIDEINRFGLGDEIFQILSRYISNASIQESFASLLAFQYLIDEFPEVISENLKTVLLFIVQMADISNHHCVCEEALICIQHLIHDINGGLVGYTDTLLQPLIKALSIDHEPIIIYSLSAITSLLTTLEVKISSIYIIYNSIMPKLNLSLKVLNEGSLALGALIFSAGTDIVEIDNNIINQLLSHFINMIQMNENAYPILKSYAAEALGRLVKNAPSITGQFTQQIISLLAQCLTCNDLSIISSSISAFTILIDYDHPLIKPAIQASLQKAIEILNIELPDTSPEEEDFDIYTNEPSNIQYAAKCTSLKFIKALIETNINVNDLFRPEFFQLIQKHLFCDDISTRLASLKVIALFYIKRIYNPLEIIEIFGNLILQDDDMLIVMKTFSLISKLIDQNTPVEILHNISILSKDGLLCKLQCQNNESSNSTSLDFYRCVFKVFSKIAQFYPDGYPFKAVLQFLYKDRQFDFSDKASLTSISLSNFFIFGSSPEDVKQTILQIELKAMNQCDGTISPSPIMAIQFLLKSNSLTLNPPTLSAIFSYAESIFSSEDEGKPTYEETISAVVLLLFTIFLKIGDQFNINSYFDIMLSVFPIHFKKIANETYSNFVQVIKAYNQILIPFSPQIIISLSKVLSLKDEYFSSLCIHNEVVSEMIEILKSLINANPNSQQLITQTLENQSCIERIMIRLNS